jgi:alpha-mannosidase
MNNQIKSLFACCLLLAFGLESPAQNPDTVKTPKLLNWGYFANGTIHVIASSHNDIAWFDTPSETIARRDHASITPALKKMSTRPDVTFCMENVLYLLEYLDRHPEKMGDL